MGLRGPGAGRAKLARAQADAEPVDEPFPWEASDLSTFERCVAFMEFLPITKGILAGTQMELLPEQREFLFEIISRLKPNGRRLRRLGVLSEPKGNGKTGFCAGLALCFLIGPLAEKRGEVYAAAVDRTQSSIMFKEIEAIIDYVPRFAAVCNCKRHEKKIEVVCHARTRHFGHAAGSSFEAMSSDARKGHGLAALLWLYDEFAQVPDRELFDNLMQGMGKRLEPLGIVLSTQARDDTHPLSQLIDDGLENMRTGDGSIYVQLHAAPEDADPFDEEVWKSCNPAWGKFLDETDLRMQADLARKNPAFMPAFRNLKLNQRVEAVAQARIVDLATWKLLGGPLRYATPGAMCFGGLDLSGKLDLTAFVLAFPGPGDFYDIVPYFWTPRGALERRGKREQDLFRLWSEQGFLQFVDGPVVEFAFVATQLVRLAKTFDVRAIGYDRWRISEFEHALGEVIEGDAELTGTGFSLQLEPFGQGFKDMGPAVENFAELAYSGRLRHDENPVMTSCVSNAILVSDDASNQKFAKGKSNAGSPVRIDGLVAGAMALGTAKRILAADPGPSIYETRGLAEVVAS